MIRPTIDMRDVMKQWHRAPEQFEALLGAAVSMTAHEGIAVMAALTPEGADRHLKLGWMAAPVVVGHANVESGVRNAVPYAYYVDQGRKPGKMPPHDAIERWVHAKLGVSASGVEREAGHLRNDARKQRKPRTARSARPVASSVGSTGSRSREPISRESLIYLIRRKIAQKGTFTPNQPPKMLDNGKKKITPIAQRHVLAALAELEARLSSL